MENKSETVSFAAFAAIHGLDANELIAESIKSGIDIEINGKVVKSVSDKVIVYIGDDRHLNSWEV